MKQLAIAMVMTVTVATGCSTLKSAAGALGGKPNQVTVVNNIEPQPVVVNVQPVVQAPAPAPAPVEPKRSRFAALKAVAGGAVAGAVVGTVVGYAIDGSDGAKTGAAIGAGAGAVGGGVAHQTR